MKPAAQISDSFRAVYVMAQYISKLSQHTPSLSSLPRILGMVLYDILGSHCG
jgi:hypothetical protein